MNIQKQALFWLIALLVFAALMFLLQDVLLPFIAGLTIAYLLDPLADRLEALRIGRTAASLIILGLFVVIVIVSMVALLPLLAHQLAAFTEKLPGTISRLQELVAGELGPYLARVSGQGGLTTIQKYIGDFVGQSASWAASFASSLWSGGQAIVSILSLVVVTPVVAFYMLIDWDRMIATVDSWIPLRHRDTVRMLAKEIDTAIAGFVRGQALVCLSLGTFYAVGLTLVGLNFGVLIGLGSGFLSFIPYVGSFTGLIVSLAVAIVQFWPDYTMVGIVLGIYLVGQFLEGNILSPYLVGNAIGLHPVWLMFALFAFGSLFGFIGLLLAVPLAAAVSVIIRFGLRQYLTSAFYDESNMQPALHRAIDADVARDA